MNEEKLNLKAYAAFVKAQNEFTPVIFDCVNPHFKNKYASLQSCFEAVRKAFNKNGLFLSQKHHITDKTIGIETILVHESGETLSSGILYMPVDKVTPQGFGSALTYARRYSLMTFCGIAGEEDDDANKAEQSITFEKQKTPAPVKAVVIQNNTEERFMFPWEKPAFKKGKFVDEFTDKIILDDISYCLKMNKKDSDYGKALIKEGLKRNICDGQGNPIQLTDEIPF